MKLWEGKGGNTIAASKYLKLFLCFPIPTPSSLHLPSPTTQLLKSLFVLCALTLWGRTCLQRDHQGGNFVYRAKDHLREGHAAAAFLGNFDRIFDGKSPQLENCRLLTDPKEGEAVFIRECWHLIWTSPLKLVILSSLCSW